MKKILSKRRIFCMAVVIAVIIVPFLYSYFYLGAFWDPYSKLDSLPVAVVNNDRGAMINDFQRNLGSELCDRLKEDGTLKFVFTDEANAKKGTEGREYYAMITIPEDFSESIASAGEVNKQKATIIYSPNEKRNYLASQILSRAMVELEEATIASVDQELVQTLSDNIKEVPAQLTQLQDGLGKLKAGSVDLLQGMNTLSAGSKTLLSGTTDLAKGTSSLEDGSKDLANGTETLQEGSSTLQKGANTLAKGTKNYYEKIGEYKVGMDSAKNGSLALSTGADSLKTGIDQLKNGTDLLIESTSNIDQLSGGTTTLADGIKTFDTSLSQYTTGVDSLITTVGSTSSFLTQYVKDHPELLMDPTFAAFISKLSDPNAAASLKTLKEAGPKLNSASTDLVAGSEQLKEGSAGLSDLSTALASLSEGAGKLQLGASDLATGATSLKDGIKALSTATDQLYTGAKDINSGATKLSDGAEDLDDGAVSLKGGANELYSGVKQLNSGAQDLNSGVQDLKDGTDQLYQGTSDLSEGIGTAKSGVDSALTNATDQIAGLEGIAQYAAEPVSIEQENVTSVANYGTAFAPYFMSLSLFVGAIILFVGIYLDNEGKFKILSRESNRKTARSFIYLLIGFAQALALALIIRKGLGLKVDNIPLFYLSACLVSMVFISIVQFLMVHLKSVGKLLSIVVLILQLTSCGGTFPMELVPKAFNVLYPFMPMTYSVELFKQAITDTNRKAVLYNGGILAAILIVFMTLTILLSVIKTKRAVSTKTQEPVLE